MTRVRVAVGSVNQTPLDWRGNRDRIVEAIREARSQEASILCLPELCISGYGCEDAFGSAGVAATSLEMLGNVIPETKGMIVALGLPLLHDRALFNTACVAADGRIAGFVPKQILAGEGLHYEPRWFKPWPAGLHDSVVVDGQAYPLGNLVFDCGGVRFGVEICEDAWAVNRPGVSASLRGADLILNLSASHFAFGKFETRKRLVVESSRSLELSYVYANLLGNEAGRVIYDGGGLIASGGKLIAQGPRLTFKPFQVISAVVDLAETRMSRTRSRHWEPVSRQSDEPIVVHEFSWPEIEPTVAAPIATKWEASDYLKEEEFLRAVTLGLFDYLRKSRSRGFIVSLSGGADSSSVACLVAMMVEMAVSELGIEGFAAALGNPAWADSATDVGQIVREILHCVYQATVNSSDATRRAATTLADSIGARMSCLEIDSIVAGYRDMIEATIGRSLSWKTDDLALQNIQARVRAPSVWFLANLSGALLLSTSNRSEAAVGYATMDGDTCGGLSPIAGVDKAFLRKWLTWLEEVGPTGLHPIPALSAVNQLAPTAELRPSGAHQTDEDDLMPYPLLDAIERSAIRDKQMPVDVFRLMRAQFPEYALDQLHGWVARFFRLWCRNQWKRERYAPSFHLDDENLDPKTWCRFPILSGGYEWELAELDEYVLGKKAPETS